ncbi:MAG: M28 family peptidase [Bacteroidota bacterium]|nr:M28 family peptidase [Bacteroidota bacterium]
MKSIHYLFVLAIIIISCSPTVHEFISNEITQEELRQHIRFLASDELKGRRAGDPGNTEAAKYIAQKFQEYGLTPAGDDKTYYQNFSFVSATKVGERNKLAITMNGNSFDLSVSEQYKPLSFSIDTSLSTQLVFVGFGISAPESLNYDDYKGIDVKNKIVMVLRYSPDTSSSDRFEKYSSLMAKLFTARDKGASGIILVTMPPGMRGESLTSFEDPRAGTSGIAVLGMKWSVADSLLRMAGKNLDDIKYQIETTLAPASFELSTTIDLQTQIVKVYAKTANVIGLLPGSDSTLKDETLIIGAHFDHIGMGGEGSGSLKPDTIAPHHGADDNASGTAGLLEIAQYFSSQRALLKRSILFVAFTGEELGVLGSDYYVKHPFYPLEKTITMINMDMIGRMKDSILVVEGMGTSPKFEEMVKRFNSDSLVLTLKPDGFGPSDQASFYKKDLPVMFFFTNLHSDYHKPSDTWDKINYSGEQKVVQLASRIIKELANENERPVFTKAASTMPMGGDRQGARVSLGIIPDFAGDTPGMKISGFRPGSPAEKAGLKADDVIIKFGGKDIKNIYDFTHLLGIFKPGDEVEIVVNRDNKEIILKAILETKK